MRWLTQLAVICICGFTVAWGWQATRFAEVRAVVLDDPAANISLNAWYGVPGLTVEALETYSRRPIAVVPPAVRHAEISTLLTVHPMSAQTWLSLAGERRAAGRPTSDVEAAVTMSRLTGPNEGTVMWRRGLFELLRWPGLSVNARRQAAADLVSAVNAGAVNDEGLRLAKSVLAQQSPEILSGIAAELGRAGFSEAQLAWIGLKAGQS